MTFGSRPKLALTLPAIAGALMVLAEPGHAQQQNDAAKAQGLERAQKAADAVFHWIKLNADKGASRTPPPPPPPAPAPVAAKKPAAVAAAPKPAPAAATAPAVQAQAPAPEPVAAPVVAAAQPEPEPERTPVLVAAAAPTPAPAAPLAAAARAVEPPPAPEVDDVPLKLLVKVEPTIPRQLQQQAFRSGFAQVQFTVAPDGTVSRAQSLKASNTRLGAAAVEAIKQWRFAPIPKARDAAVEVAFNNGE